jgi:hypothetical protein
MNTKISLATRYLSKLHFVVESTKYKSEIKSNKECIERWIKEKVIQTSYVSFLYELETDYEKRTNLSFVDTTQKN